MHLIHSYHPRNQVFQSKCDLVHKQIILLNPQKSKFFKLTYILKSTVQKILCKNSHQILKKTLHHANKDLNMSITMFSIKSVLWRPGDQVRVQESAMDVRELQNLPRPPTR